MYTSDVLDTLTLVTPNRRYFHVEVEDIAALSEGS
jgi:hypothetical protein